MQRSLLVIMTAVAANAACSSSHSATMKVSPTRLVRASDTSPLPTMAPDPTTEIEALIRQKVEGAYDRYCIFVLLKHITVAPVPDVPDQFWFTGDHYMQYPDDPLPVRFTMKGVCDTRKRTARVYRLTQAPGGCFPTPAAIPSTSTQVGLPRGTLVPVLGTGI